MTDTYLAFLINFEWGTRCSCLVVKLNKLVQAQPYSPISSITPNERITHMNADLHALAGKTIVSVESDTPEAFESLTLHLSDGTSLVITEEMQAGRLNVHLRNPWDIT